MPITKGYLRNEVGLNEVLLACNVLGVREGRYTQWLANALGLACVDNNVNTEEENNNQFSAQKESAGKRSSTENNIQLKKLKLIEPIAHEPITFELVFEPYIEKIRHSSSLKPANFSDNNQQLPYQPLFQKRWVQGIFTMMLSTKIFSNEIDFRKLEQIVAKDENFTQLPFKSKASLVKGVHILLDRSESMQPFWRDQTELVVQISRLLGKELVQCFCFEYDPLSPINSRLIWTTQKPRKFREKTPILIITDFGRGLDPIGSKFLEWEPWEPIFKLAKSSGCRTFALIPALSQFWPINLNRFVDAALLWDSNTSPRDATRQCQW